MSDEPTAEEVDPVARRMKRWIFWLGIPAALAASLAGLASVTDFASRGAWSLVEHAAAQQSDSAILVHHKAHDSSPHKDAATKTDMQEIKDQIEAAVTAIQAAATDAKAAARMAGSTLCREVGGRPHPEMSVCVFVVNGGDIEIVPLDDEVALRAKSKLTRAQKQGLDRRRRNP